MHLRLYSPSKAFWREEDYIKAAQLYARGCTMYSLVVEHLMLVASG
jgi:hypothetical protein